MTVYELIQKLIQYDADMDVEINVASEKYQTYVQVSEDVSDGDETRVEVEMDEYVSDFDVDSCYSYSKRRNMVRTNVELT